MNTPYTKEQISQLEAGPELDRLVANEVMGYNKHRSQGMHGGEPIWLDEGRNGLPITCPKFSTDMAAAFQVADKIRPFSLYCGDGEYSIRYRFETIYESAASLPDLICKVALLDRFDL